MNTADFIVLAFFVGVASGVFVGIGISSMRRPVACRTCAFFRRAQELDRMERHIAARRLAEHID